jgi:hypothetical protein
MGACFFRQLGEKPRFDLIFHTKIKHLGFWATQTNAQKELQKLVIYHIQVYFDVLQFD